MFLKEPLYVAVISRSTLIPKILELTTETQYEMMKETNAFDFLPEDPFEELLAEKDTHYYSLIYYPHYLNILYLSTNLEKLQWSLAGTSVGLEAFILQRRQEAKEPCLN